MMDNYDFEKYTLAHFALLNQTIFLLKVLKHSFCLVNSRSSFSDTDPKKLP